MKKKTSVLYIVLLLVCLAAGCASGQNDNMAGTIQDMSVETGEHAGILAELPGNIEVCFDYREFPKVVEYWKLEENELDIEQIKEQIFPEVTVKYQIEELPYPYNGKQLKTEAEEFSLQISNDLSGYISGGRNKLRNEYYDILYGREILEEPKEAEGFELDFMNLEEVEEKVRNMYKEIFPHFELQEMLIEGFDVEYLQKLQEGLMEDELQREWTSWHDWKEGMDVYYFKGRIGINGISFNDVSFTMMNDITIPECYMEGLINCDGFVDVVIMPIYKVSSMCEREIISYEEALVGAVAERYGNPFAVYQDKILDVKLQYMILPDSFTGEEYTVPVWVFTREYMTEKDGEAHTSQKEVLVNAITGKLVE